MLVAEVSKDVGARAVLDELVRLGAVDVDDDGLVRLKSHGFVPKDGLRESFHFLADNVSEHLSAAVHNMNGAALAVVSQTHALSFGSVDRADGGDRVHR